MFQCSLQTAVPLDRMIIPFLASSEEGGDSFSVIRDLCKSAIIRYDETVPSTGRSAVSCPTPQEEVTHQLALVFHKIIERLHRET